MSNELTEFVDLTINVQDLAISQAGFGEALLLPENVHSVFTNRTKRYSSLNAVAEDWATTTKVYKMASKLFTQTNPVSSIKIGKKESGDSDLTETLNEIVDEDNDWYALQIFEHSSAQILKAAAWTESQRKVFGVATEDSDVKQDVDTDIASQLKALNYKRSFHMYHHEAGVDLTGLSISVSGGNATVTKSSHGLRVNDPITITGVTDLTELNGDQTVKTVPTDDTFTFTTTASNGSASGTITAFARYTFPEAAWIGEVFGSYVPGEATWAFKQLTGVETTPKTIMTKTEKDIVLGKNSNVYVEIASVGITQDGKMASGRYIDVTRSIDWIHARIQEAIFSKMATLAKIPFSNAGASIVDSELRGVFDEGLRRTVLQPLLDDAENRPYIITIPDVADVSSSNRINRILPDVKFEIQLAGAIHKVVINGNLII